MKTHFTVASAFALTFLFSCETLADSVIKAVDRTNDKLTKQT